MRLVTASLLLIAATQTAAAAKTMVVPFVEDDYAAALSQARARKLPIFVEVWAPW